MGRGSARGIRCVGREGLRVMHVVYFMLRCVVLFCWHCHVCLVCTWKSFSLRVRVFCVRGTCIEFAFLSGVPVCDVGSRYCSLFVWYVFLRVSLILGFSLALAPTRVIRAAGDHWGHAGKVRYKTASGACLRVALPLLVCIIVCPVD